MTLRMLLGCSHGAPPRAPATAPPAAIARPALASPPGSKQPTNIPELIATLRDAPDLTARTEASASLGAIGSAAVPALIPLLASPDPELRVRASYVLALMAPGEAGSAFEELAAAHSDAEPRVRWNAATALGNIGEEAEATLRTARDRLGHDQEDDFEFIERALRAIRDRRGAPR